MLVSGSQQSDSILLHTFVAPAIFHVNSATAVEPSGFTTFTQRTWLQHAFFSGQDIIEFRYESANLALAVLDPVPCTAAKDEVDALLLANVAYETSSKSGDIEFLSMISGIFGFMQ